MGAGDLAEPGRLAKKVVPLATLMQATRGREGSDSYRDGFPNENTVTDHHRSKQVGILELTSGTPA